MKQAIGVRTSGVFRTSVFAARVIQGAADGLITTYLSWLWIFFMNIPFGPLAGWLARLFLPDVPGASRLAFDAVGFAQLAARIVGVTGGASIATLRCW